MDVIRSGERSSTYGGRFTGEVEFEMLREAPSGDVPDVALVRFAAGAVTNWHAHPGGQLLYVVEGRARVGTGPDGAVDLEPGTLVVAPGGERHWHGAAAGADAAVLSFAWGVTAWEDEAPVDAVPPG